MSEVASMGKYKPYLAFKSSGADWLGDVPKNWNVIKVGRLFNRTKKTGFADKELLSVYRDYGVIPKSSRDDNNNKPSDDLSPYQLVQPTNLVMNKMKTWQGSIAISEYEGIVSPAYFVYEIVRSKQSLFLPRYVHYLLRNPLYIAQYLRRSKGIRVNQWDLDPEEFEMIELLLPSIEEQQAIFDFLDQETSKIDLLIEKQQKLIELLKEKRQAVISHAVTKGLNPNAKMKDSGIQWLGHIPEHWVVMPLKRVANLTGGYAFKSDDFKASGIQLIRIGNVYQNRLSLERQPVFMEHSFLGSHIDYVVRPNDLLISLTGTLGKRDYGYAVLNDTTNEYLLNQRVGKFVFDKKKIHYLYALNLLHSEGYLNQLYSLPFGTKQANLSNDDVLGITIALPPTLEEQAEINAYIDAKTQKIDTLIDKSQQAIELLKERKTALISAAVTGKIDVRNFSD